MRHASVTTVLLFLFAASNGLYAPIQVKNMRDAVIVSSVRTPVGKAFKGTLRSTRPDDLAAIAIQEAIRRDVVGRVVQFESRIDRFRPEVRDRWREIPGPGAGLLYDLSPHLIDQTLVLFGAPDSVQAATARQRRGGRTDDFFQIVLRYGESIAILQCGSLVSGGTSRFSLHGDRASVVKVKPDIQEDQLRSGITPDSTEWGVDPDDATIYEGASGKTRTLKAARGDQRGFYRAVQEALLGRGPNPVPAEQGATVMAIIEAALRSSETGRRVVPELKKEERGAW